MTNIKSKDPKQYFLNINPYSFNFEYNERNFEMFTKLKEEADLWIACLRFLAEMR